MNVHLKLSQKQRGGNCIIYFFKKYIFYILFAVIVLLFTVIIIFKNNGSQYIREHEITAYLKDGDVICRLGEKIWSSVAKEISPADKRFSHMGIIRIRDDAVSVIHVEGATKDKKDYVKEVPLTDFLHPAQTIGIFRLNDINGYKVSDLALEYLGVPFDRDFDKNDNSKLYCTELLYVILKRIAPGIALNTIWLENLNKYVIPIDIVSQSEYFMEIGYWERENSTERIDKNHIN